MSILTRERASGVLVNDIHSRLNPTCVREIVSPTSPHALCQLVAAARRAKTAVSVAGGRHSMGGQQFGTNTVLCDMTRLNRVLAFDPQSGIVEVEAGIQWPELIDHLITVQAGDSESWTVGQKQTGANRLTIGGAVAANIHGRGLQMPPLVSDIESLVLVDANGASQTCSRSENSELFRLVIGGYGLFGIVYSAKLRLVPRRKLQRIVELISVDDLMARFTQRIAEGHLYGDFQYAIDPDAADFLRRGVFSCYRPVSKDTPIPNNQKHLSEGDWARLGYLAHTDKSRAFAEYAAHYLATSGQIYWSDMHQIGIYLDDYHQALDAKLGAACPASEVITEIFVPRNMLVPFLDDVREDFRANAVNLIYGTVRLIERDTDSFLAWAKEPYACVIFNLHVEHSPHEEAASAQTFRRLIDLAIRRGGSYYLPYHRHATRTQVQACYPQFPDFLRLKRRYDPEARFQSDWYRHYAALFAQGCPAV